MSEEPNGHTGDGAAELRPIITRLVDLQRKCRSIGSRTDEAIDIDQRIESVLAQLDAVNEPESEPVPFTELARQLYAVERFFESNGFLSVAKEVIHVERALAALAPSDEAPARGESTVDPSDELLVRPQTEVKSEPEVDEAAADRWKMPRPVAATLLVFFIAVVACLVIIFKYGQGPVETTSRNTEQPTQVPTVAARPTPTPRSPSARPTPGPGARLAKDVGNARLAIAQGDIDTAMEHISSAALVDSDHATVLDAAQQVVDLLIQRSNDAAAVGEWETADVALARALQIAGRFGFDTKPIDEAVRRQSQLDRFRLLMPGDTQEIQAAAGKRVTVHLVDGSSQEAIIKGVRGAVLLLTEDTTMRGGTVYYVDKVPLDRIRHLQVWED